MSNTIRILYIIGAGPRVGWGIAEKFRNEGYKVAVGSRAPDVPAAMGAGFIPIQVDAADPTSIASSFVTVREKLGIPNVVVFNAVAWSQTNLNDLFSDDIDNLVKETNLNAIGGYASIKEAVRGFHELPVETPKAFIATGNILPWGPFPPFYYTLGASKAALAHIIETGAIFYRRKNFRFYFASQVSDQGYPVGSRALSGEAHGDIYWELANEESQGKWEVRFTHESRRMPGIA